MPQSGSLFADERMNFITSSAIQDLSYRGSQTSTSREGNIINNEMSLGENTGDLENNPSYFN